MVICPLLIYIPVDYLKHQGDNDMHEALRRWMIRCLVPAAFVLVFTGQAYTQQEQPLSQIQKMTVQSQIANLVRSEFVDSIDVNVLWDGAIQGMIDKLDPHSSYMPPESYDDFSEKIRGNFEGVGITFAVLKDTITVIDIIPDGPSMKAGLLPRDRIVTIDGKSAIGVTNDQVKELLRGPADSKVTVQVVRPGVAKPLPFPITRERVDLDSVSHSYMLDDKTGYIAVSSFTLVANLDVLKALATLKLQGMRQLVLDLRGNSGGSLDAAIKVVDCFIKSGLIVSTKGRNVADQQIWNATGRAAYSDLPLIVLVNHGSASASEIVAGALQDHDRALVVGQTSFGKGLVMNPYVLHQADTSLGTLMLTIARYYTPSGRLIQRPYDGESREEYIAEGLDEYDPNAANIDKSKLPQFKTDLGRIVYGGGGITPDKVLLPGNKLNDLESELRQSNLVFQFADEFLMRRQDVPRRFEQFLTSFHLSDDEFTRFHEFILANKVESGEKVPLHDALAKLFTDYNIAGPQTDAIKSSFASSGINIDETLFDQSKDFIEREVKMELARMIWGNDYRYRVFDSGDTELIGALQYFPEAANLLNQRIALGEVKR